MNRILGRIARRRRRDIGGLSDLRALGAARNALLSRFALLRGLLRNRQPFRMQAGSAGRFDISGPVRSSFVLSFAGSRDPAGRNAGFGAQGRQLGPKPTFRDRDAVRFATPRSEFGASLQRPLGNGMAIEPPVGLRDERPCLLRLIAKLVGASKFGH